jgi:predicted nucleotidyltransferase
MSTSEFEEKISNAVKTLYGIPGVVLLALYGSVARGEHDRRSDIDLLMVYESRGAQAHAYDTVLKVLSDLDAKIQLHETNIEDMASEDSVFVENVLREGIVLFAKPSFKIPVEKVLSLKPYSLFTYSVKGLKQKQVMALRRALYTYRWAKKVEGKKYSYEYRGVVSRYGKKLGKSCFVVPNEIAKNVRSIFERIGVPYEEITIWLKGELPS